MRATTWTLAAAALLLAGGCSKSSGPSAPPDLTNVFWIAGGQRTLVWADTQPDGGLGVLAPPGVQEVDFVFDQRLDGAKIEGAATPPVVVARAADPGTPLTAAPVTYNSEPFYGGSSSYLFLRPAPVGVPSSDTVVFTLAKALITGADNQPVNAPDTIAVATGPLTAVVRLPSGDAGAAVPTSYLVPIAFSNRVDPAAVAPYVHASVGSAAVPVSVAGAAGDATEVYVTAACAGGWPTVGPVTVTVDSRAPDAFGGLLAAPASGTFTAVSPDGPGDAGCPN
jgi:hypothetical protein